MTRRAAWLSLLLILMVLLVVVAGLSAGAMRTIERPPTPVPQAREVIRHAPPPPPRPPRRQVAPVTLSEAPEETQLCAEVANMDHLDIPAPIIRDVLLNAGALVSVADVACLHAAGISDSTAEMLEAWAETRGLVALPSRGMGDAPVSDTADEDQIRPTRNR